MVADHTARKKSILSMRFPVIANTPQLGLAIHQRQKNKKRKVKRQKVTNKELKKVLNGIRRIPNESEREDSRIKISLN